MTEESQGITRREMLKRGAVFSGTLLWAVPTIQTIGMRAALADTPSICSQRWADEVVDFNQQKRSDGLAVDGARSNPNNARFAPGAPPENPGEEPWVSLGFGGDITVKFASPAFRTSGAFVVVVETTFGSYPLEKADVLLSDDGLIFHGAGVARNDNAAGVSNLTIPAVLSQVQWVKIVDTTDAALFPAPKTGDGFDVNSVGIDCFD